MFKFCDELFLNLNNKQKDPIFIASWIIYKIDLTDHFFVDGLKLRCKNKINYESAKTVSHP